MQPQRKNSEVLHPVYGRIDLVKFQQFQRMQGGIVQHPPVFVENRRRGRIRRALAYLAGGVLGMVMFWALCWGMTFACVLLGGSAKVCGL